MKTIEEYAVDMVANGAESQIEDDLNEDEGIRQQDHRAACDLGLAMVRAIREYPGVLVAMGRREQIEVPEADDSALFGLSAEQEIRDRAVLHSREWHPTAGPREMFATAAEIARFIETGSPDEPATESENDE